MQVASFFSGIGGFDLGLERAGMEVVFQCEINAFAQKVLRKHWPDVMLRSDIQVLNAKDVPDADLYCGGFPCQDLSLANQGKRTGLKGKRSGLFYKFADLVSRRQPRWVVLENVPGLLNSQNGLDFEVVINTLDELGYGVAWRVFDAKYFGTPQRRRRVFIVASYSSLRSATVLLDEKTLAIPARTGTSQEEVPSTRNGNGYTEPNLYTIQHASVGRKHTAGPQAKGYRNDGETWTLDSRGSSDVVCATDDAFGIRSTPGLSDRLDANRYRVLGNAVSVPIVEWVGRRIVAVDANNIEPDNQFYPIELQEPKRQQLRLFDEG